jgi:hypothetical protein
MDLDSARKMLSPQYLDGNLLNSSVERVRPIQGAAIALLSRILLHVKNWRRAEELSSLIISNTMLYNLVPLNDVFLKNSGESIWQLQPVQEGWNTEDARAFIIPSTGPDPYLNTIYLSQSLMQKFGPADQRKKNWVDSVVANGTTYYYPSKYKNAAYGNQVTEYQMMLRLGEQYLIRAEARAQQGKISEANADLNTIHQRAGLPPVNFNSKSALLIAILAERQVELFTEMGQRWQDLKRTGMVDMVMQKITPLKAAGAPWRSFQKLYPIPIEDLQANPNLVQNDGY